MSRISLFTRPNIIWGAVAAIALVIGDFRLNATFVSAQTSGGEVVIRAARGLYSVTVTEEKHHLDAFEAMRWWGVAEPGEALVVTNLQITRAGKKLILPRSAVAGLTKVDKITVLSDETPKVHRCTVVIIGSDASLGWDARFDIINGELVQRSVHGEVAELNWEKTVYHNFPLDEPDSSLGNRDQKIATLRRKLAEMQSERVKLISKLQESQRSEVALVQSLDKVQRLVHRTQEMSTDLTQKLLKQEQRNNGARAN